jgi:PhnB protein
MYKEIFGGQYTNLSRFKDMPPMPGMDYDDKNKERIMNIGLPINPHTILYGCDSNPNMGEVKWGKNISLSVDAGSKDTADRFYKMLSAGGKVFMPMADMFWGAYWGMCEDRFGIT